MGIWVLTLKVILDLVLLVTYSLNSQRVHIKQTQPSLTLTALTFYIMYGITNYVFQSDLYYWKLTCAIQSFISSLTIAVCTFIMVLKMVPLLSNMSGRMSRFERAIKRFSATMYPLGEENQLDINVDLLISRNRHCKLSILISGISFILLNSLITLIVFQYEVYKQGYHAERCFSLLPISFSVSLSGSIILFFVIRLSLFEINTTVDIFRLNLQYKIKLVVLTLHLTLITLESLFFYKKLDHYFPAESFLLLNTAFVFCSTTLPVLLHRNLDKNHFVAKFDRVWNNCEMRQELFVICRQAFIIQYLYFLSETSKELLAVYTQKDLRRIANKYFNSSSPYFIELDYFLVWHVNRNKEVDVIAIDNIRKSLIFILTNEVLAYMK
eukprot:NODE_65_length_23997_cov_0.327601.p6 type:complete len:382 gc:universal NODE_65_length_23997_cov_0.327601:19807-18662(-)